MAQQKPDALLILGDTNSCLSAIAAKRLHIPIFHTVSYTHLSINRGITLPRLAMTLP